MQRSYTCTEYTDRKAATWAAEIAWVVQVKDKGYPVVAEAAVEWAAAAVDVASAFLVTNCG
jgi:hypothetical protein